MARLSPVLILAITILSLEASAGSITLNTSLHSYLSTYIPNSTINTASFYNMTLNHHTYVIMQLSTGVNRFIVINTTGGLYSVVLNASGISPVLGAFFIGKDYPNQSTLNNLRTSMLAYINQSAGPINDCLTETGLGQYTHARITTPAIRARPYPYARGLWTASEAQAAIRRHRS